MKQLLLSLLSIGVITFAGYKATTAFFSDSETSPNNTFQAGAIELKIHNQSYIWRNNQWEYNQDNSWALQNMLPQFTFFNFSDVKPGDLSQDTVELKVETNPAWVCADITLTESSENSVLEPESTDGDDASNGPWDGELDQELQFIFWADDGDYTLEVDEPILHQGNLASLPQGDGNQGVSLPLIDSQTNPWATVGQPMNSGPEGKIWIGKAWCHGTLTTNPQPEADGISQQRPPSILCNGEAQTNISQTDSVKGDISFSAIQSRNNESYICESTALDSFSDDFNDGDANRWWLGNSLAYPYNPGNWRVENGTLIQDTGHDGLIALYNGVQFSAQEIQATFSNFNDSGYGGVVLWYKDNDNYSLVRMYKGVGGLWVSEKIDGVYGDVFYTYPYPFEPWYTPNTLKVVANDAGNLAIYIDGNFARNHQVQTTNRVGRSGVFNGNSGGYIDDFSVMPI